MHNTPTIDRALDLVGLPVIHTKDLFFQEMGYIDQANLDCLSLYHDVMKWVCEALNRLTQEGIHIEALACLKGSTDLENLGMAIDNFIETIKEIENA